MRGRGFGKHREAEKPLASRAPAPPSAAPTGRASAMALQRSIGNTAFSALVTGAASAHSADHDGTAPVQRTAEESPERPGPAAGHAAPELRDVISRMAQELHVPPRLLEMELFASENIIMSIGFDERYAQLPVREALARFAPEFTSICGETANLLRQFTFQTESRPSSAPLHQLIAEIRSPGNANLQIQGNGHAFFVEKRGTNCRIMQSYIGQYSLMDSLEGKEGAGAGSVEAEQLARNLEEIGAHHLQEDSVHDLERQLFGGALLNRDDVKDGVVRLNYARTPHVADAEEQRRRIDEQRSRHAAGWQKAKDFEGNTGDFAMTLFS